MTISFKTLTACAWLLVFSSYGGLPMLSISSPIGFRELDESTGVKCSSNHTIGAHMVCNRAIDCKDTSDEIYCIHQSLRFETNGTFTDGEKICTQVANDCSCVQVTVTLSKDGEELYELSKPHTEENVTSDSNFTTTEKSNDEENSPSSCDRFQTLATSCPSGFHELEESIGFKCNSNNTISAHMVCDKIFDCEDHSDEIYCIHQSLCSESSGTFTDGEKICTQVANDCSCVEVTVTIGEEGEEIYELLKPHVEENFISDSNENITKKPNDEKNHLSSNDGPPMHSTSSPFGFRELDESTSVKCSSNHTIGAHMVCNGAIDCKDTSDEMYCIHQSLRFETNGTFTDGEKICTQVDKYCSCVQVTVTIGEDGEEVYELLKPHVEDNFTTWIWIAVGVVVIVLLLIGAVILCRRKYTCTPTAHPTQPKKSRKMKNKTQIISMETRVSKPGPICESWD